VPGSTLLGASCAFCGDNLRPAEALCLADRGCATPGQLSSCAGKATGEPCSTSRTSGGVCDGDLVCIAGGCGNGVVEPATEAFDEALTTLMGRVLVDKDNGNQAILDRLAHNGIRYHLARSPVMLARAKKNATEIHGMRQAHVRDGVAVAGWGPSGLSGSGDPRRGGAAFGVNAAGEVIGL